MVGNQIEKANCCCEVYTNLDWIVSHDTVIRPDMMVVCGAQPQRHLEKTPALLAEVLSETTRNRDLLAKRGICHQQRVPNYLIIDPDAKSVERIYAMGTRVYGDNDLVEIELDESCRSPITIECSKLFE
jgi:Uma2 family endonuclease